ncbi:hypothetical protein ACHQM5_003197 [Ranunculus cassubicifolius]
MLRFRSSIAAASKMLRQIGSASSRPLILHPSPFIFTPLVNLTRQFAVSSRFSMAQSRSYGRGRTPAVDESEYESEDDDDDDEDGEGFDSEDLEDVDSENFDGSESD